MRQRLRLIYLAALLISFNSIAKNTDEALSSTTTLRDTYLKEAYLAQWFAIDSNEPINIKLKTIENDAFGARSKFTFTSDDGQTVNGLIGFPSNSKDNLGIVIALHPMGLSQKFWWSDKSPLPAYKVSNALRKKGYIVISLDARMHGERGNKRFGAKELIKRAHSDTPRLYIDTIIGSVRDYRALLNWAKGEFKPKQTIVMGYSMGAQMSLLLASYEPTINHVIAMVPPYVESPTLPVAPRVHTPRIKSASVLWLAGNKDPHSSASQTEEAFQQISSGTKTLKWFDAGHRLPIESIDAVIGYVNSLDQHAEKGEKQ